MLDLGALPDGDRYMVMEFLDGETLGERIKTRGRLTAARARPIASRCSRGSPPRTAPGSFTAISSRTTSSCSNSRGGKADFVKILDFGISKFNALLGDSGISMTRTGAVMGTPYYMSPEQAQGRARDRRPRRLYAVGVILYEALTGQVPFNAETFNELIFKIVLEAPPPPEQVGPGFDRGFAAIIAKAMARDPAHRFQSASEMQNAISMWASGHGAELPPH